MIHCEECGQEIGNVDTDEAFADGCPHGNGEACELGSRCFECCMMYDVPPAY